ncbi:hypothetical protein ACEK07_46655 [Alcanivoracaceae bacterium MT1]
MAYTSRYMDGVDIADYDDEISGLIAQDWEPGFFGRLRLAIENRDAQVYRVIAVEGLNAYVTLCQRLEAQGFVNRLWDSVGGPYCGQYRKG